MGRYVTVADSMSQAVNTYVPALTSPDGTSISDIAIQRGETMITKLFVGLIIDGAWTVDTGNNFTAKFSGKGMVDSDQEVNLGALKCDETGTSVTGTLTAGPITPLAVEIKVKEGHITVSIAMDGTDPGTPFGVIGLEIQ